MDVSDGSERNPFRKMHYFSEIARDKDTMRVFLSIAHHKRRTDSELATETGLNTTKVDYILSRLEFGKFIERNPTPASRNFKLSFNGQLFAEQLKSGYPELHTILGEDSLIESIKR